MKTFLNGCIGFVVILAIAIIAIHFFKPARHAKQVVVKTAVCPGGGVMVGKDFWPSGS